MTGGGGSREANFQYCVHEGWLTVILMECFRTVFKVE
jgi:hypothetical protein